MDLMPTEDAKAFPADDIAPPPTHDFEVSNWGVCIYIYMSSFRKQVSFSCFALEESSVIFDGRERVSVWAHRELVCGDTKGVIRSAPIFSVANGWIMI